MEALKEVSANNKAAKTIALKTGSGLILESAVAALIVIVPAGAVVLSPLWIMRFGLTLLDCVLFLSFYVLTIVGIAVGYHRFFTHRSFEAKKGVKIFLAIAGELAMQGPIIRWVADHRRHHSFTDETGDPHSPHLPSQNFFKGLWHAHSGWFFDAEKTIIRKYAPDLMCDRTVIKIDKLYFLWTATSLLLPAFIGLVVTRNWQGAFSAFLFGGLIRVFAVNQVIWAVNSFCHYFGSKPNKINDNSTNVWWL